jgi:hypothetical protein
MPGVRAVYPTHLHDLAQQADTINKETDGSGKVASMVSMYNKSIKMVEKSKEHIK